MARIRRLEVQNFRSIQQLDWSPSAGINCLVGPGDSGKSSIIDAIDLCLGARRSAPFGDTDFHRLDVTQPITISVTLGALPDALLNLETYGEFLRGYDAATRQVEDEPRAGIETVLTLKLTVTSDLEPSWSLYSERAEQQGVERGLTWKDRSTLAPARIGSFASTKPLVNPRQLVVCRSHAELGGSHRHASSMQLVAVLSQQLEAVGASIC